MENTNKCTLGFNALYFMLLHSYMFWAFWVILRGYPEGPKHVGVKQHKIESIGTSCAFVDVFHCFYELMHRDETH
jgi:hypothetical protein